MKIASIIFVLAFFSLTFSSCLNDDSVAPTVIVEPPELQLLGRDTINAGSYLGLTIGERAENTYTAVQTLKDSKGVEYLNIVGNIYTDVTKLKERIPLYRSLFLDEMEGSSTGVQMTFEDDKVKSIFLSNGNQIPQWPVSLLGSSAIATGDNVAVLYEKLVKINGINRYKNKLERMNLLTKYVAKTYDPNMSLSPQWYFAYLFEGDKMDEVQLNFKDGILYSIYINHYLSPPTE